MFSSLAKPLAKSVAAGARRLAINPYGDLFPDDDSTKEITLQADGFKTADTGDRHVLLRWTNGIDQTETRYTQIIQLTGGPGNYAFHKTQVEVHSVTSLLTNTFYVLGQYTREQRNQIIALASSIQFNMKTRLNSCRTWTRFLLEAMVDAGLLSNAVFNHIDADVPLKKPIQELSESDANT